MELSTYLTFNGNCEEALNFYQQALGGEITYLGRFEEGPEEVPDNWKKKVMHANLTFHNGTQLMASDIIHGQPVIFGHNITLSLNFETIPELEKAFEALSHGGKIGTPLQDTFWNARFGLVTDKFGIHWMFNCNLESHKSNKQ